MISVTQLRRELGHHFARHDAMIDQLRQPVREDVAGDPELLLELLEMMDPVERGAKDHERPPLAHRLQRERQRAVVAVNVVQRFA